MWAKGHQRDTYCMGSDVTGLEAEKHEGWIKVEGILFPHCKLHVNAADTTNACARPYNEKPFQSSQQPANDQQLLPLIKSGNLSYTIHIQLASFR